jgi:DNA polymerase III delta prime subunit
MIGLLQKTPRVGIYQIITGKHYFSFVFKGKRIFVVMTVPDNVVMYTIGHCSGKVLGDVVKHIVELYEQELRELSKENVVVYRPNMDSNFLVEPWVVDAVKPKRECESVCLDNGIMQMLIHDVETFLGAKELYREKRQTYQRGFLLHGPPGTGKTSSIFVLASKFDKSICKLDSHRTPNTVSYTYLFNNLPSNGMLVIEDIDAFSCVRRNDPIEKKQKQNEAREMWECRFDNFFPSPSTFPQTTEAVPTTKVTMENPDLNRFPELINAMDGLATVTDENGRLFFLTANDKEKIDPAIGRGGRIDKSVEYRNLSWHQAVELTASLCTQETIVSIETFLRPLYGALADKKISPADLNSFLLRNGTSLQEAAKYLESLNCTGYNMMKPYTKRDYGSLHWMYSLYPFWGHIVSMGGIVRDCMPKPICLFLDFIQANVYYSDSLFDRIRNNSPPNHVYFSEDWSECTLPTKDFYTLDDIQEMIDSLTPFQRRHFVFTRSQIDQLYTLYNQQGTNVYELGDGYGCKHTEFGVNTICQQVLFGANHNCLFSTIANLAHYKEETIMNKATEYVNNKKLRRLPLFLLEGNEAKTSSSMCDLEEEVWNPSMYDFLHLFGVEEYLPYFHERNIQTVEDWKQTLDEHISKRGFELQKEYDQINKEELPYKALDDWFQEFESWIAATFPESISYIKSQTRTLRTCWDAPTDDEPDKTNARPHVKPAILANITTNPSKARDLLFPTRSMIVDMCKIVFGKHEVKKYMDFADSIVNPSNGMLMFVTSKQLLKHFERNGMVPIPESVLHTFWFYKFHCWAESLLAQQYSPATEYSYFQSKDTLTRYVHERCSDIYIKE